MINESISRDSPQFVGYYENARTNLLDLLQGERPTRILEIGCGGGANLAELKRRFPGCHVTGVELRQDAADAARSRVDQVLVGSVLDAGAVDFPRESFDLIVLSHVLEHFAQPEAVLERAKHWLTPGGRLLVALPNVRHLSVLKDLLVGGDFRYQPSGILDHTHLRFFTRKSAERFLHDNGLTVIRAAADVEGPKSRMIRTLTFGLGTEFAAFAYNFLARRS